MSYHVLPPLKKSNLPQEFLFQNDSFAYILLFQQNPPSVLSLQVHIPPIQVLIHLQTFPLLVPFPYPKFQTERFSTN